MRPSVIVICGLFLAGCQGNSPLPAGPVACAAPGYQSLVGHGIAAVTLPADVLLRIIQPSDAVTMDFRVDRLNFELDADGVIARVSCG